MTNTDASSLPTASRQTLVTRHPMGERVERAEHVVAQLALSGWAEASVTVDPLVQLTGSACTAAAVRNSKVVEDEQFAGSQVELDLDVRDAEAMLLEERDFGAESLELRAAGSQGRPSRSEDVLRLLLRLQRRGLGCPQRNRERHPRRHGFGRRRSVHRAARRTAATRAGPAARRAARVS
jgi:hypothetical protein